MHVRKFVSKSYLLGHSSQFHLESALMVLKFFFKISPLVCIHGRSKSTKLQQNNINCFCGAVYSSCTFDWTLFFKVIRTSRHSGEMETSYLVEFICSCRQDKYAAAAANRNRPSCMWKTVGISVCGSCAFICTMSLPQYFSEGLDWSAWPETGPQGKKTAKIKAWGYIS